MNGSSLAAAVPEIYLAGAICVILLVDVFAGERRRGLTATLTLLALALGAGLTVQYGHVTQRTLLFDRMYVADELGFALKLAAFLFVAVALLYSRTYLENRSILRGEYYVLALTALLGIFVLVSANNLLTVYLGVELLALSVYAMVAFDRDSGIAAEAAMKYFVLGAIASGALLYGMSLIYGLTGTLDLGEIAARLQRPFSPGVILGLTFIVVAVAFKLGAVPFHMWLPDVYEGAPTSVTLFIGTAPKIAYFALTLRLLAQSLAGTETEWSQMLAVLAVLTLVVGNVVAIVQTNLKRMLAYSGVAHMGYLLLALVTFDRASLAPLLVYLLAYVLMNAGAFAVVGLLYSRPGARHEIEELAGWGYRYPLLGGCLAICMLSLGGIPPTMGFLGKYLVFQQAVAAGHVRLAVLGVVASLVGVYYYLRVVYVLYMRPERRQPEGLLIDGWGRAAAVIAALATLVLGLWPADLLQWLIAATGAR